MNNPPIEEALDYCLANPDGLSVEELLQRFPEHREELQPLLVLSTNIAQVTLLEPPPVPAESRAAMKARLQDAAFTNPRQVLATPQKKPAVLVGRKPWWLAVMGRRSLAAASTAALFLLFFWWAAASALPDSPFYGIKLASENFMLNFAGDDAGRAQAHLNLANTRLAELQAMGERGKLSAAGLAIDNYGSHINSCSTLLLMGRTGDARADIQSRLGESINRCDTIIKGFGSDLAQISATTQSKLIDLYRTMVAISAAINTTPPQSPRQLPGTPDGTAATIPSATVAKATPSPVRAATATSQSAAATPSGTPTIPTIIAASPTANAPTATQVFLPLVTPTSASNRVPTTRPRQSPTRIPPPSTSTPVQQPLTTPSLPRPTNTLVVPRGTPTLRPTQVPVLTRTLPVPTATSISIPEVTITSLPVIATPTLPLPTVTVPPIPTLIPTNTPIIQLPTSPPLPTLPLPTAVLPTLPVPTIPLPTLPPILPTSTPRPPATPPTTPAATNTPTELLCSIRIDDVSIDCAGEEVVWHMDLGNNSGNQASALWTAELQARLPSGTWVPVGVATGTIEVPPSGAFYVDRFGAGLPLGATRIKVRVTVAEVGLPVCTEARNSNEREPCGP